MLAQFKGWSRSSLCTLTMGRSPCCEKAHTNRGAWTKEEDQLLIAYIKAHGEGCWRSLPKAAGCPCMTGYGYSSYFCWCLITDFSVST